MNPQDAPSPLPIQPGAVPRWAVAVLVITLAGCAVYVNLSFLVTNLDTYRYFPPFRPGVNDNFNRHLGGEYYRMARALAAGEGFSHPFDRRTGPTAWHPPVLPLLLAGLYRACGSDRDTLMAVVIFLQTLVLIATGLLMLSLARQTSHAGPGLALWVFLFVLLCNFSWYFQWTHDTWIVMLLLDLLVAGLIWYRPLEAPWSAAGWGIFGGLCALTSPVVGFTWAVLSLFAGWWRRTWGALGLAALLSILTVTPWTVRNYLVFGRWVPLKSNLAYEAYQTQCLQTDGLLEGATFSHHPYGASKPERREYEQLGEMAYMDRKWRQFLESVRADPWDFLSRIGSRLAGATVDYVPFYRASEAKRPLVTWFCRLTHPLAFLALVVLVVSALKRRLHWAQWCVIGIYVFYLLPYVVLSYYERYAVALAGVKALLMIWAADRVLSYGSRGRAWDPQHPVTE